MPEQTCDQTATYRYTWPGRDEAFICEEHSKKFASVANAMGLYLQLVPIETTATCEQKVSQKGS